MAKRILVLGSSFAGFVAAMEARRRLPEHEVVVLSASRDFLYTPSLIWVPFGLRRAEDISFPIEPVLERHGVEFRHGAAERIDLPARRVHTAVSEEPYDYLVIATGPKFVYDGTRGLGPHKGYTQSIFSLGEAERTRGAFEHLLRHPGPVVVGAVPGAAYLAPAYEFLFNLAYQLRQRGLLKRVPLTFLTPEPHLGHFGTGSFTGARTLVAAFCRQLHVTAVTDARIQEVTPQAVQLADGRSFPFSLAMLAPPSVGADVVRACTDIVDEDGFVQVEDTYQTRAYPEVFAAGSAVSLPASSRTRAACRVPSNMYASENMASIVAHNIAALINNSLDSRGEPLLRMAAGNLPMSQIMDGGNTGMILNADRYLRPGDSTVISVGPGAHFMKLSLERDKLNARRHGHIL